MPASSASGALPELTKPGEMALTVMPYGASAFGSRRIGDVAPHGDRAPAGFRDSRSRLCSFAFGRPVAQGDVPPRRGQVQPNRAADPFRPARDQRDFGHSKAL